MFRAAPDAACRRGVDALLDEATSSSAEGLVDVDVDVEEGAEEGAEEGDDMDGDVATKTTKTMKTTTTTTRRDVTAKEIENNVDAAGHLLAESMKGAAHGLHSRAPRVLRRVLRPSARVLRRDGETDADVALSRAYDVAEKTIDALAKHTRRGKCAAMWSRALRAARRACAAVKAKG